MVDMEYAVLEGGGSLGWCVIKRKRKPEEPIVGPWTILVSGIRLKPVADQIADALQYMYNTQ